MEFCRLLKMSDLDVNQTFYIVLDKAERLRTSLESHLLPLFLRLGELTGLNICVIFITDIVLEKFFTTTGFLLPIPIHFPDYSKDDLIIIMSLDCPRGYKEEFYKRYCSVVVGVFYSACRDTAELRHLVSSQFKFKLFYMFRI